MFAKTEKQHLVLFNIVFLLLLIPISLFAQAKEKNETDDYSFNSFMVSFDYSSNTGISGIYNTEINQPSYTPSISFFSKYGFDISSMLFVMDNSDTTYSGSTLQLDLMAGYTVKLGKHFTVYPNYSHYFVNEKSGALKSFYTDNIQLDVTFEYSFFMSALTGNYLFGKENNTPLLSFQNYFLIEKDNFIFNRLYVALQPGFDLTWSNQQYISNYAYDYLSSSPENRRRFFRNNPKLAVGYLYLKREYPDMMEDQILRLLTLRYMEIEEKFNLSSLTFTLPVYFMFGNFSISLSGMYYKPLNTSEYVDDSGQFYLNAGIAYMFSW